MTRSSPDLSIAWPRTLVWNTNPTLDVASAVPSLSVGTVHRADYQGVAAGGKGTLVIRALTALGGECDGVAPLAGDVGAFVRELLHNEGLTLHISEVSGQTRVAVSVSESNRGRDTVVNGPGPTADDGLWQEHIELVKSLLGGGRYQYFLIAGRPPPTASTTIMAELTRLSQGLGVRTVCDTSSPYFESCLTEKPWLMKVNCHEAAEALRISKSGHELVKEVLERGAQNVILTDGPHTVRGSLEGTAFSLSLIHISEPTRPY